MAAFQSCCSLVFLVLCALSCADGNRNFIYTITNQLEAPMFTHTLVLKLIGQQNLAHYMGNAVDNSTSFTGFSATWFDNLGLCITAVNRVAEGMYSPNEYREWTISTHDGTLPRGAASSYFPEKDDHVTIAFTSVSIL